MKRKEEKIDGERNRGLGGGEVRGPCMYCTSKTGPLVPLKSTSPSTYS